MESTAMLDALRGQINLCLSHNEALAAKHQQKVQKEAEKLRQAEEQLRLKEEQELRDAQARQQEEEKRAAEADRAKAEADAGEALFLSLAPFTSKQLFRGFFFSNAVLSNAMQALQAK